MKGLRESIQNHPRDYIIFYSDWCGYSQKALNLLKSNNVKYKKITFEQCGGVDNVIQIFKSLPSLKYNTQHKTRPMIIKDGRFIGGYTDLLKYLNNI